MRPAIRHGIVSRTEGCVFVASPATTSNASMPATGHMKVGIPMLANPALRAVAVPTASPTARLKARNVVWNEQGRRICSRHTEISRRRHPPGKEGGRGLPSEWRARPWPQPPDGALFRHRQTSSSGRFNDSDRTLEQFRETKLHGFDLPARHHPRCEANIRSFSPGVGAQILNAECAQLGLVRPQSGASRRDLEREGLGHPVLASDPHTAIKPLIRASHCGKRTTDTAPQLAARASAPATPPRARRRLATALHTYAVSSGF